MRVANYLVGISRAVTYHTSRANFHDSSKLKPHGVSPGIGGSYCGGNYRTDSKLVDLEIVSRFIKLLFCGRFQ